MVVANIVVVNLYDEKLYNKGHLVERWASGLRKDISVATKAEAPVNKRRNKSGSAKTAQPTGPPGFLKANIRVTKQRTGTREFTMNQSSRAGYSLYVIEGTAGGDRTGTRLRRYRLPLNSRYGRKKKIAKFRGIVPNDFLNAGLDTASIRHPCLRG